MAVSFGFRAGSLALGSGGGGSEPTLITKNITENNTYNASSDGADGYSSVTVNVPSLPSGDYDDPFGITSDFSKFNFDSLYSCYYIDDGVLKKEIVGYLKAGSGYEGFCVNLSKFGLTNGTQYTASFELELPSNFTFSSYQFGLSYQSTRRPSSGNPNSETFNFSPTVNFQKQTGTQTVSFTFTANSTNYIAFTFSGVEGSNNGWIFLRDFKIEEA